MGKTIMVFREPPRSLYKANNGNGLYLAETKAMTEGFPGSSVVKKKKKNPPANTRDTGLIPGSGRSPGKGNGNPLQYSSLRNPMDKGASCATVHGVAKSQT